MDKNKLEVMWQVVDGYQSVHWAAAKLKKSERTIKRYVARLRSNPEDDLIHKNRGRNPVNKIDHEKIWQLYMKKYYGMNITFFCEKLLENEIIKVSEGLVRLIFKEHDDYNNNKDKIASELFNYHVSDENKEEMKQCLADEGYSIKEKKAQFVAAEIKNGKIKILPNLPKLADLTESPQDDLNISQTENKSTPQNFIFEKLQAAGIEVVKDKEEFDRILESHNILQKMEASSDEENNPLFLADEKELKDFAQKVDDWKAGNLKPTEVISEFSTSTVLQAINIPANKVSIDQLVLKKINALETEKVGNSYGHDIDIENIKKIPQYLSDPIMVYNSASRKESYTVLTEAIDKNKESILIALQINKFEDGIYVNNITSAYGKDENEWFIEQIKLGNLVYQDKKRSLEWTNHRRLSLPNQMTTQGSLNVIQKEDIVNKRTVNFDLNERKIEFTENQQHFLKSIGFENSLNEDGSLSKSSFFIKDTADFEMFEEFETITGLTAKEAINEYKKLREGGLTAGIGINIPSDTTFNDPKGLGTTILVRNNGIDSFDIYGDSFIVDLKENNEKAQNRIAAYKELYEEAKAQGLNVKEPTFLFEKERELKTFELKTYHILKEDDIKNLDVISDEDFSDIVDCIILNDYKHIPNVIRLPNLNEKLSEKLGLSKESAFILKKSATHIRPDRKGSYDQALDTEEYRMIPQIMSEATFALVDKRQKNFQIVFDDNNNIEKINKIVFNKDELGNYLVTIGKVDRRDSISEKENVVVGVGVAPTISALRFPEELPATRLRPSPTTISNNITQNKNMSSEKEKVLNQEKTKLFIITENQSVRAIKGKDYYLLPTYEDAENYAERYREDIKAEWDEWKERNTFYSPATGTFIRDYNEYGDEEEEHSPYDDEPEEDLDPKPEKSEYTSYEVEEVDFDDERVKKLIELNNFREKDKELLTSLGLFETQQENLSEDVSFDSSFDNIPQYAVYYMSYGEDDSLSDDDKKLIDDFMKKNNLSTLVEAEDYPSFTNSPAFGLPCDCVKATFSLIDPQLKVQEKINLSDSLKIEIPQVLNYFGSKYELFYDSYPADGQIIHNNNVYDKENVLKLEKELVLLFDSQMKENEIFKTFVQNAAKERGDIFSSDRECAALLMAIKEIGLEKELGFEIPELKRNEIATLSQIELNQSKITEKEIINRVEKGKNLVKSYFFEHWKDDKEKGVFDLWAINDAMRYVGFNPEIQNYENGKYVDVYNQEEKKELEKINQTMKNLLNEYSSELIERINNGSNKFLFIFEKLQAAGIEVVIDKDEYQWMKEHIDEINITLNMLDEKPLQIQFNEKKEIEELSTSYNDTQTRSQSLNSKNILDSLNSQVFINNLNSLSNIKNKIDSKEFLSSLKKAFYLDDTKSSNYVHNKNNNTELRLSNHCANAITSKKYDKSTSIVIKLVRGKNAPKFRKSPEADLIEFAYYPENLTLETEKEIINGLIDWIKTGEYTYTQADEFHQSTPDTLTNDEFVELKTTKNKMGSCFGESVVQSNNVLIRIKEEISLYNARKRLQEKINNLPKENGVKVKDGNVFLFFENSAKFISAEIKNGKISILPMLPELADFSVVPPIPNNISQTEDKSTPQSFITQDGTTYGFTHEGKIYLNPDIVTSEAALHEYTHLWDNYTKVTNPELWNKGKEDVKEFFKDNDERKFIGIIPSECMQLFEGIEDYHLYADKSYLIHHYINRHPDVRLYDNIQNVLDNYTNVYYDNEQNSIGFVKVYGNLADCLFVKNNNGKIVLFGSTYNQPEFRLHSSRYKKITPAKEQE